MDGGVAELLKSWTSREGCGFADSGIVKVDAAIICHDVRCVGVSASKLSISFKKERSGRSDGEVSASVGEMCHLKALQLDTIVLLRVWDSTDKQRDKRSCGEARVPLRHLVSKCDGALYHSWMTLDSVGLSDSVGSLSQSMSGCTDGEAFAQSLLNGPKQLFQPKVCISICKSEHLSPSGQILWTQEMQRKERISHWGPLLRSQQQHVIMCTAQHLHNSRLPVDPRAQSERSDEVEKMNRQVSDKEQEILTLYEKLRNREESLREVTGKKKTRMTELEERGAMQFAKSRELAESTAERAQRRAREAETNGEAERQRTIADQLKTEKNALQEELATIGDEANGKIEAANERIRSLRKERDDAQRDQEQLVADNKQLFLSIQELTDEKDKLAEQKESLISIVEDLHQACTGAGLSLTERTSMDTIRNLKF